MTRTEFPICIARWEDARDRADLQAVRFAVFMVEQRIPAELESDEHDAQAVHLLARDGAGNPVGCARLLPDGHIGRMAVLRGWRGRGIGSALLQFAVEQARRRGHAQALLEAQSHALDFYARHGFSAEGEEFLDAGIPHRRMHRPLG